MRLAILCSGQAGQRREMLDAILAAPDCAPLVALAGEVLGRDVAQWWRGLGDDALYANRNAQFAIALLEIAGWLRLQPLLPAPVVVAGYSLGELVAYVVAGALDARTCLQLALTRAHLMDEAAAQAGDCMLLLRGAALARWQGAPPPGLHVAIRRCAGGVVLGGAVDVVGEFASRHRDDADVVLLPVRVPSHTPLLAQAAQAFREELERSPLQAPRCPVLAGIDATPVRSRAAAIEALSRQICSTLRWDLCMEALERMRLDAALELGPGNDLSRLMADATDVTARALADFHDAAGAAQWARTR